MKTKKSDLQVKILSLNTLYEHAQKCVEHENKILTPFIGEDVLKVDGSFKKKYEHERVNFKGQMADGTFYDVHYWFTSDYGYLDMRIKSCIHGGSYEDKTYFCQYDETTYTLFKLVEGKLQPNTERNNTDYSQRYEEQPIIEQAAKVKVLAEQYEREVGKIPHFFKGAMNIKRLAY